MELLYTARLNQITLMATNNTALDYGIVFANTTLKLLPDLIKNAKELEHLLQAHEVLQKGAS